MSAVAGFEHLLKSYDIADLLDDIASSDPPAYLRRCFAEASSTPVLSFARVQQVAGCAMVLDAVLNAREYPNLEPELIADWRVHYVSAFAKLRESACAALQRSLEPAAAPEVDEELRELEQRLEHA